MSEEADEPSEREIDDAYAAAVDTLRGLVRLESALAAEKLRQVAVLAAVAEAAGRAELAVGPRVPGQPGTRRCWRPRSSASPPPRWASRSTRHPGPC